MQVFLLLPFFVNFLLISAKSSGLKLSSGSQVLSPFSHSTRMSRLPFLNFADGRLLMIHVLFVDVWESGMLGVSAVCGKARFGVFSCASVGVLDSGKGCVCMGSCCSW